MFCFEVKKLGLLLFKILYLRFGYIEELMPENITKDGKFNYAIAGEGTPIVVLHGLMGRKDFKL